VLDAIKQTEENNEMANELSCIVPQLMCILYGNNFSELPATVVKHTELLKGGL
jgi:hypothetical protein